MHTHFDNFHNKAGYYQCKCSSTFDWMPAYLRHTNACTEELKDTKEPPQKTDPSSINVIIKEEKVDQSFSSQLEATDPIEYQPAVKRYKIHNQQIVQSDTNIPPKTQTLKSSFNLYICPKCPNSFPNSNALLNHQCIGAVTQNPTKETVENLTTVNIKPEETLSTVPAIPSPFIPSPMLIELICHCRQIFTDYQAYKFHNIICKDKPTPDHVRESTPNSEQNSPPLSKNMIKDCVPNGEGKYECPTCSKSFTTHISLKQHFTGMHLKEAKKCSKCGKFFNWLNSYNQHIRKCLSQ